MIFAKETHQHKSRYYFENRSGYKCSPYFHSEEGANRWRTYHLQNIYGGTEHRLRQGDRRLHPEERTKLAMPVLANITVLGRRETDQTLRVDRDLTNDHIDRLLEWSWGGGLETSELIRAISFQTTIGSFLLSLVDT